MFSAHGRLDPANPARSAVVLGLPPGGTEPDRYLTAREIARLDLRADLVVVLTCVSGSGRVAAGEGILGLPYAFFAAGVGRALLTRWEIYDDPITAGFVSEFVTAVAKGRDADEALAEVRAKVR